MNHTVFEVIGPGHPDRFSVESFIKSVFLEAYGAQITHFADTLMGMRNAEGEWLAALGFSPAGEKQLFIENYDGGPIESQVSRKVGEQVLRDQIVEVGNMAARSSGDARKLILLSVEFFRKRGFSWFVFTATRSLKNSFLKLGMAPIELSPADPNCLPDRGKDWGSYYDHQPMVMTGRI